MKFVFDLDGTLTAAETLPMIASYFGVSQEIDKLTQDTIQGRVPFDQSLKQRVRILGQFSVSETHKEIAKTPLLDDVVDFINTHKDDCLIATGNLDVWTQGLAQRFACEFRSSTALVINDSVHKIDRILDKVEVVRGLQTQGETVVFVGDGHNDALAMQRADIAVASGIVHAPADSVISASHFAVYSEDGLLALLNALVRHTGQDTPGAPFKDVPPSVVTLKPLDWSEPV